MGEVAVTNIVRETWGEKAAGDLGEPEPGLESRNEVQVLIRFEVLLIIIKIKRVRREGM